MVTTNCNTKDENQVNDNPPTPLKKSSPPPPNGQINVGLISFGVQKLCHFKNSKQGMWWNSVKGWYKKWTWETKNTQTKLPQLMREKKNYIVVAM